MSAVSFLCNVLPGKQSSKLKKLKVEVRKNFKVQNPKPKIQNPTILFRDYVQKNLKSSLDVIDKSPPHSCYISMLVKRFKHRQISSISQYMYMLGRFVLRCCSSDTNISPKQTKKLLNRFEAVSALMQNIL